MDPDPPGSVLVPLLLLLALPPPGRGCSSDFSPVSSTFGSRLDALSRWLLLDYLVPMPSNLEPDPSCSDLWGLHFGVSALGRMAAAAGGSLAPQLRALAAHLRFVGECEVQDPQGCVRLRPVNASQLLEALRRHLGGLQRRPPPEFPACRRLRCLPDPSSAPPPAQPPSGTLQDPPGPGGHGLVLLGGLGGALGLLAAAWALRRRPCGQSRLLCGTGGTGQGRYSETPSDPPGPLTDAPGAPAQCRGRTGGGS